MSSKQNKAQAQKKARKQEEIELEQELLKTKFPMECEALPIEELTHEEQIIVNKCINHEELTDFEFKKLKKILVTYRDAINKYNVNETLESVEKTVEIIHTEQELLEILDSPEMRTLLVHLPINNKTYELNFEILPLDNSAAVKGISTQLELFKDFSKREAQIYTKAQQGQILSAEEEAILRKVNKEIEKRTNEQKEEIIITLLANQLKLPGSDSNLEERKHFWERFPFNAKVSIFMKMQDKLGLTEYSNEKLFPTM